MRGSGREYNYGVMVFQRPHHTCNYLQYNSTPPFVTLLNYVIRCYCARWLQGHRCCEMTHLKSPLLLVTLSAEQYVADVSTTTISIC